MAKTHPKKTYSELKAELEETLAQLESESVDIDQALELYKKAQSLIEELKSYLNQTKHKFEVLKADKK